MLNRQQVAKGDVENAADIASAASPSLCFHVLLGRHEPHFMDEPTNRRLIWWLCVRVSSCVGCFNRLVVQNRYEKREIRENGQIRQTSLKFQDKA